MHRTSDPHLEPNLIELRERPRLEPTNGDALEKDAVSIFEREHLPPGDKATLQKQLFLAPAKTSEALARPDVTSFSVVIAAYNASTTIGDAVASALAQTFPPLEVLVCDDGSTDELAEALEPFNGRIVLLRQANGGEGAAKNTAAAAAAGAFLVFLDADDTFDPTRLERLAELAACRPDLDVLTTDAYLVVERTRVGRCYSSSWAFEVDDQRREILRRNFVFGLAAVRRKRFEEIGGFDSQFTHAVDWDLWIRLIITGSGVGLVDEPLAEYRLHRESLSANRPSLLRGRAAVLEKTAGLAALSSDERTFVLSTAAEQRGLAIALEARVALRDRSPLARSLALRAVREPALKKGARLKALAAAAAPSAVGTLIRMTEARQGIGGPAGVRFDAAAGASAPTPPEQAHL